MARVDIDQKPKVVLPTKKTIHNIFLIDRSGSMGGFGNTSKYSNAIRGLNKLLTDINADTETDNTISIIEFNQYGIDWNYHFDRNVKSYNGTVPDGQTPLNQAIGETLDKAMAVRSKNFDPSDKILLMVFTDGGENDSRGKYQTFDSVREILGRAQSNGVTCTFSGPSSVITYAVDNLGFDKTNVEVHNNTGAEFERVFTKTAMARKAYSSDLSRGLDVSLAFYSKVTK